MASLFRCPGPIWEVGDLNPCVNEKYLQFWAPIIAVSISIFSLSSYIWPRIERVWKNSLKRAYARLRRRRRSGPIALADDDEEDQDEDEDVDGTPLVFNSRFTDDNGSDSDNELYRLNTNENGYSGSSVTELSPLQREISLLSIDQPPNFDHASHRRNSRNHHEGIYHEDGRGNADVGDVEIRFVRQRGDRARAASEQFLLLAIIMFHFAVLAVRLFYDPEEEWNHVAMRSSIAILFWLYLFFLSLYKNSRLLISVPIMIYVHAIFMYFLSWLIASLDLRTIFIRNVSFLTQLITVANFLVSTGVCIVTLASPVGHPPAYIETVKGLEPNPQPMASLFSVLSFSWVGSLVKVGMFRPLTIEDVWDLEDDLRSCRVSIQFRDVRGSLSFVHGLFKYFYWDFALSSLDTAVYAFLSFVPTLLVKAILEYMENPDERPCHVAWFYVFLLMFSSIIYSVFTARAVWGFRLLCIKIRSVIISEIYTKALRRRIIAPVIRKKSSGEKHDDNHKDSQEDEDDGDSQDLDKNNMGRIINLMSIDAVKISEAMAQAAQLMKGIVMIVVALVLLLQTLGWSALAGISTMTAVMPLNYWFSKKFGKIQTELMAITDRRIHKTNEILQSIKIVKFFAWEPMFKKQLMSIRDEEIGKLKERYILWAVAVIIWFGFPTIITFVTFGFYTLVAKRDLTPSVAFSSVALFNLMRTPLDRLAEMVSDIIDVKVSLGRVGEFMNEESTDKYVQLSTARGPNSPYIGFENASFTWGDSDDRSQFQLRDLNINFEVGKLTVIIGSTGSGKTSLLMALLGEMKLLEGNVFLPSPSQGKLPKIDRTNGFSDSVAYCSQQAWLLNDSIKNNILFGSEYSPRRYQACIEACALLRDFEILDAADETEVGEKGIALSGGQKQRISLARALYSSAQHLILDDCLSAVDSHSALWIYERCILGPMMAGRTCILVSHNVSLTLVGAKNVILIEHGRVKFQGTPEAILHAGLIADDEALKSSLSSREASKAPSRVQSGHDIAAKNTGVVPRGSVLAKNNTVPETSEIIDTADAANNAERVTTKVKAAPLVQVEEQAVGQVKWSVYHTYLSSMGGHIYWIIVLVAVIAQQSGLIGQSWWIREWAEAGSVEQSTYVIGSGHSLVFYLCIYGVMSLIYMFVSFFREGVVFWGSINASRRIFERLLRTIMRAKPRFFDQTPIGRIMNRFSKDIQDIDQEVAPDALSVVHSILALLVIIILITAIVPSFIFAGILITTIFYLINLCYLRSSRELKRMQSVLRSPIFQHFGETLAGLSTIRAYGYESRFADENMAKVDTFTRPYLALWACTRWMSFLVEVSGGLVSTLAGAFMIWNVGKIDSGLAGLCLTYAITFTENMLWLVVLYAVMEMNMNSIERLIEYTEIEQEAPDIVSNSRPPLGWPEKGAIEVSGLSLKYAPDLPLVISDVSFSVKPKWKIGIVGRTGAGKSTIASAFFRFLEAEQGKIVIDGINIAEIGLKDLREALTIIPQDPTLFSGTVRSNLDPFNQYPDSAIFEALRRVHLIDENEVSAPSSSSISTPVAADYHVNIFTDLHSPITEGGGNLSQGQRQLMCLARSLLKSPRVIILDEATASIDYQTDALLQTTIRKEFSQMTILTIAHRLRSIIDYDMILVLEAGKVKEYDKPHLLLQQSHSVFRSMCESSGELSVLEELAEQAYLEQTDAEQT
ncbi:hypothetical protein V1514DRAFT_334856, partial [Lipomyces japonicus]|uniref:uncharacterized protein n=1 Tax=Lipomyces japonicus TaxID=56871 RepID=UPI0034CF942F